MNRRLSERRIRATCRELLASSVPISGRRLRRELRDRFGAVGKTERVFQIWREESQAVLVQPPTPEFLDAVESQRRLSLAEAAAKANLERAERAELREQAHQDRWAAEVDGLRQQLLTHAGRAAEFRSLQERVFKLTLELQVLRGQESITGRLDARRDQAKVPSDVSADTPLNEMLPRARLPDES